MSFEDWWEINKHFFAVSEADAKDIWEGGHKEGFKSGIYHARAAIQMMIDIKEEE